MVIKSFVLILLMSACCASGVMAETASAGTRNAAADILNQVSHGYASNGPTRIHYVSVGEGPLVVMIHGFPDFWYTWRHQMAALKDNFRVVAIDQRGYNKSDKPTGVSSYAMPNLVGDVAAVIRHLGQTSAIIVGHDWGGSVAWNFAFANPGMVDKLIVLNLPHPTGMMRTMMNNSEARANTNYAQVFREKGPDDPTVFFGGPMNPGSLSAWVRDSGARAYYMEAFRQSDFAAMLNYYKANYPAANQSSAMTPMSPPRVTAPTLVFHGLADTALHSDGLNNTWDWIDADTTIVAIPGAGHFVQQDAAEMVSSTMKWWLLARTPGK